MTHEDYVNQAIKTAKQSEAEGGIAIGAVIVKDGKIAGEGKSFVRRDRDPSDHAEIHAIRKAARALGKVDLQGCVLYSTLEPCAMCISCAVWANVSAIYFGAYRGDVAGNQYELGSSYRSEEFARATQRWDGGPIKVVGGILRADCASLLKGYVNWQKVSSMPHKGPKATTA